MPLYEFQCKDCNYVFEEWCTFDERENFPKENKCSCGGEIWQKWSTVARHSSWESTGKFGVNGTYNRGLGCVVYSQKDLEQKAAAKGLIPYHEAYSGTSWNSHTDQVMHKECERLEQHERTLVNYKDNVAKCGKTEEGMGRAAAETFTVEHMKETGAMEKSIVRRDNTPDK